MLPLTVYNEGNATWRNRKRFAQCITQDQIIFKQWISNYMRQSFKVSNQNNSLSPCLQRNSSYL